MKSIFVLCESLNIGGAERALYTLLKHIDKRKYDITLCVLCNTGYYSYLIKEINGIKYIPILTPIEKGFKGVIYRLKYNLLYKYLSSKLIYKLFLHNKADVEIAFCEGFSTKIIASSSNKNSKKIAWVHTDLLHNNWPLHNGIYKNIIEELESYSMFDSIIGVSNSVTNNLKKLLTEKAIIHTLYNLIDEQDISNNENESIDYIYNNNSINLISVGRLEYVKGYDRLINVCSKLINKDKFNITLTIVGNGSQYNNLSYLIDELNTSSTIKLLGIKENPYPYIKNADLYVCPSRDEGYNIALAEAIILGLPCVATNCSGPDEILNNGQYGCLVDNNEEALYLCLKELIYNPNKLHQLKLLSNQRKTFFDLNKNISQIESVLDE